MATAAQQSNAVTKKPFSLKHQHQLLAAFVPAHRQEWTILGGATVFEEQLSRRHVAQLAQVNLAVNNRFLRACVREGGASREGGRWWKRTALDGGRLEGMLTTRSRGAQPRVGKAIGGPLRMGPGRPTDPSHQPQRSRRKSAARPPSQPW